MHREQMRFTAVYAKILYSESTLHRTPQGTQSTNRLYEWTSTNLPAPYRESKADALPHKDRDRTVVPGSEVWLLVELSFQ